MTNKTNEAERNATAYAPREGSQVAAAILALESGPMTAKALADLLGKTSNNIGTALRQAIESDIVVKLQDAAGLLHYALSEQAPIAGYWTYHGPANDTPAPPRPLNPADPFGLLASGAGNEAFAPRVTLPTQSKHIDGPRQPYAGRAPAPPSKPNPLLTFDAAIHISGNLVITLGGTAISLNKNHQQQLHNFMSKFGESE